MYIGYFGLSEIPFSIAPNPKFLFMSDRHREALAHLTYGLGDTGGFVLLTGEVGTGKTTISRRLMEQLPENTQSAFILNPTLSSQELLATLCDELKIRYRKTGATLKTLTDKIQTKLLKNHENGINTLLIIDEAQHLQPEALEQLRLLTNLETDTKKLLQVILIGQPELKQLLQRRDLRQLAQRITARYHLMPLTLSEVKQYISHRLSIAECHRVIFDASAQKAIHQISQGIPRVINLLCERSLANAYGTNNTLINSKLVKRSAQEALGDEYKVNHWWQHAYVKTTAMVTFSALLLLLGMWWGKGFTLSDIVNSKEAPIQQSLTTTNIYKNENELNEDKALPTQVAPAASAQKSAVIASSPQKKQEEIAAVQIPNNAQNTAKAPLIKTASHTEQNTLKETLNPKKEMPLPEANKVQRPKVITKREENPNEDFTVKPSQGISSDMLARFQAAIDETSDENTDIDSQYVPKKSQTAPDFNTQKTPSLLDMPESIQNSIPSLTFDMHIYASDGEGWVRVNGRDRYEGDQVAPNVYLEQILPQQVILKYKNKTFSLPAMATW